MPHRVFICYASQDQAIAEAVCDTLESSHIPCWIAPRNVLPGTEWAESIVDALDESRVLVLVLSSGSNNSPQVIREVGRAASQGVPIIPFRIDDVSPSKSMDFFISRHQYLDALTPPLEKHLQRLTDTVQQILSRERVPPEGIGITEVEEKAKREAEEARKAQEAVARAKQEEEAAQAKREAEEAMMAREAEEKAKREAEEARKAQEAAARAKKKEEATQAKREADEAMRIREAEEKAKREAEEARKAQEAAARAKKKEEAARANREANEALRTKKVEEKARKEAEKAAKEREKREGL